MLMMKVHISEYLITSSGTKQRIKTKRYTIINIFVKLYQS
jgi:hypothetical protein